jgi:hypothetical protein
MPRKKLKEQEISDWYKETKLGDGCGFDTHCENCDPNGDCDNCFTIDGRNVEAVCGYASTCDGCGELTSHEQMQMDPETQLGYCEECVPKLPAEIRNRLLE